MMIVGVLAQLLFFTSAIVGHVGMANGNPAAVGPAATMYLFAFWLYWCYQLAHSIFLAVDTTRISSSDKVGLYIFMTTCPPLFVPLSCEVSEVRNKSVGPPRGKGARADDLLN